MRKKELKGVNEIVRRSNDQGFGTVVDVNFKNPRPMSRTFAVRQSRTYPSEYHFWNIFGFIERLEGQFGGGFCVPLSPRKLNRVVATLSFGIPIKLFRFASSLALFCWPQTKLLDHWCRGLRRQIVNRRGCRAMVLVS